MENEPELFESESYPNGNIKTEEFLKESDGETLVISNHYYENGVKSSETLYHPPFQSGQREGFYIISATYWREDGQVDEVYIVNKPHKANYEVGDIISYKTIYDYYDNGQIKEERNKKELFTDIAWGSEDDPVLVKSAKMYPRNVDIFHGKSIDWYENGQKEQEEHYKDGKIDGKWTFWYVNGQIKWEENYKDGKKDGTTTDWYENGQKKIEENYKDDEKVGMLTDWHENGQKKREGYYKNDKQNGKWNGLNENGQIFVETHYKDGKVDGRTTNWDTDGNVIGYRNYKDDELVWSYAVDKNKHYNLGALGIGGFAFPDEEVATTYRTFPKELTHTPFMNLWITWYIFQTNLDADTHHENEKDHIDAYESLSTQLPRMRKVIPSDHWQEISKEYYPNEDYDWWMDDGKLFLACQLCFTKHPPRYVGFISDDTDGYVTVDYDFLGKWKLNPHDEFWSTEESISEYKWQLGIQGTDKEKYKHLVKYFGKDNLPVWADKVKNKK